MADVWDWELRLFCSADIVGSTAYKAKQSPSNKPEWAATFSEFFRSFPEIVEVAYEQLPEGYQKCPKQLASWKFSGDEILFSVPVSNHCEGVSHIWVFKQAVSEFPIENWKKKDVPLGLKATAWVAGFPVTNRKVHIPGSEAMDYLGPSIDLGFRLSKFATPRKFIVSCALALLILDGVETCELPMDDIHLYFDGKESLKGVIDGEPYPIVYCNMRDGVAEQEEKLLGRERNHEPQLLKEYLRNFIVNSPKLIRPFIDGDDNPKYSKIPPNIQKLREEMKAEEEDRGYLLNGEEEGPVTSGKTKTPKEPSIKKQGPE